MVWKVRLCFFDRTEGREMRDPRNIEGTMTCSPEGTTLEFPAVVTPREVWMVEVKMGDGSSETMPVAMAVSAS